MITLKINAAKETHKKWLMVVVTRVATCSLGP